MSPILPLWVLLHEPPTPSAVNAHSLLPRSAVTQANPEAITSSLSGGRSTSAHVVGDAARGRDLPFWSARLERDLESFSSRWSVRFQRVTPLAPALAAPLEKDATAPEGLSTKLQSPYELEHNPRPHHESPLELADRVETDLDAARTALGSLDVESARRILDGVESLLLKHPELPQAAWLMAERHHIAAELVERSSSTIQAREQAEELRELAHVLEGARVMPFREGRERDHGQGLTSPVSLSITGIGPRDELEWDGVPQSSALSTRPGKHHVRVLRSARLAWAGWVQVSPDQRLLALPVPSASPCSAEDLSGTKDADPTPLAPAGTACTQWAVARARGNSLEVALCRREQCGRWYSVQTEPVWFRGPAQPVEARGFPGWAIYTGLGAGAALALGAVLVSSGWFSRSPPRETWHYEGLR